jgi:hypothetical protein
MPTKVKAAPAPVADEVMEEPVYEAPEEDEGDYDENEEIDNDPDEPVRKVGQELLDFVEAKTKDGRTLTDIAYQAGYYTLTKTGSERVLKAQFNQALLEAKGYDLGGRSKSAGTGRGGSGLSRARVSGSGLLLVSQLAAREVGAIPGSVFSIEYPTGDLTGPGAQILLTLTDEFREVVPRGSRSEEEPGTPLLDEAA